MKLSFISALALAMAGSATASPNFLRSSEKDVANLQGSPSSGEVGIQIHGVEEDTLTEECRTIITDAFAAAFEQVYGEKGLSGTIKPDSEQVFKESSPDTFTKASSDLSGFWSLRYFYWYGVYWDCRFCGGPDEDPPAFLQNVGSNKHADFENAMKDILDASSCAAFKKLTSVSILDRASALANTAVKVTL